MGRRSPLDLKFGPKHGKTSVRVKQASRREPRLLRPSPWFAAGPGKLGGRVGWLGWFPGALPWTPGGHVHTRHREAQSPHTDLRPQTCGERGAALPRGCVSVSGSGPDPCSPHSREGQQGSQGGEKGRRGGPGAGAAGGRLSDFSAGPGPALNVYLFCFYVFVTDFLAGLRYRGRVHLAISCGAASPPTTRATVPCARLSLHSGHRALGLNTRRLGVKIYPRRWAAPGHCP